VPQLERVIRRAGEVLALEPLDVRGIEEAERCDVSLAEDVRDGVAQLGLEPGGQRGLERRLPPRQHLRRYTPAHRVPKYLLAALQTELQPVGNARGELDHLVIEE